MSCKPSPFVIRPLEDRDYDAWRLLWDAYNAFYGRVDATALPEETTQTTWTALTTSDASLHGLVAESAGEVIGLAHYLFHPSTTLPAGVCYLQDLIVAEDARQRGVGTRLIEAVKSAARLAGVPRV